MPAEASPSVLFVMPPGGVTPRFSEHLGAAFLRAMLARAGIRSEQYLPGRNVSLPTFARFLRERRPAIVGFTAYESNLRACRAMAAAAHAHTSALRIAEVYAWRGEKEPALEWVERASAVPGGLEEIRLSPFLRSLAREPRFLAVLEKAKLPAK